MWLIILEAALALFLLLFIVWWTMFHKSKNDGEVRKESQNEESQNNKAENNEAKNKGRGPR